MPQYKNALKNILLVSLKYPHVLILLFLFASVVLSIFLFYRPFSQAQAQSASFTFGAVGDHGYSASPTSRHSLNMQKIGELDLDFFLSLGDLSYGGTQESTWCAWVKSNINTGAGQSGYADTFPFLIISGGHENGRDNTNDGLIENFVSSTCLPKPSSINIVESPNTGTNPSSIGNYAKEYYFDYPTSSPYARFIAVDPQLRMLYGYDTSTTNCSSGDCLNFDVTSSPRLSWLINTIREAKAEGYWVIVANHENYISVGEKSNEVGTKYFNTLVAEGVDLILQGHDHTYQRSKQLKFNGTTCTAISSSTSTAANTNCIVPDSDSNPNTYTRGEGTLLVISGMGGVGFYQLGSGDVHLPYFQTYQNNAYGFPKYTVTPTSINAVFQRTSGATYSDEFTITDSGTPTPTPTPASSTTVNSSPAVSTDDAEQPAAGGAVTLTSTDIELVVDGATTQVVGSRFPGLNVPQGANITNAYIEFNADEAQTETTNLTFKAEAVDNSATFTTATNNISGRSTTIASVNWNSVPSWVIGTKYQTPNLSSVIQEVINRTGWASGNALSIIVSGTGHRTADAKDKSGGIPAKLVVTYSTGPTPTPTPTNTPTPTPTPGGSQSTLNPIHDSYVVGNAVNSNFGQATDLQVDIQDPNGPRKETYMMFDLQSISGSVTEAKLRMYATNTSTGTHTIRNVPSTSWDEGTITFANKPTPGSTITTFIPSGSINTWKEVDITSAVAAGAGANMSLHIDSTTADGFVFSSAESATNKVELVITTGGAPTYTISGTVYVDTNEDGIQNGNENGYNGATVTLTPSSAQGTSNSSGAYTIGNISGGTYSVQLTVPSGYQATTTNPAQADVGPNQTIHFGIKATSTTSSFVTTADTYVDANAATSNFGTLDKLQMDNSPATYAYLKFDLTSLAGKTVTNAKLKIRTYSDAFANSPGNLNIKKVTDTSWVESGTGGMTYNTRPTISTTILGTLTGPNVIDTSYEIPLTVSEIQSGVGGLYSLALDLAHSDAMRVFSRQAITSGNRPELIITYTP